MHYAEKSEFRFSRLRRHLKTFVVVTNNVNKVGKGEGVVLVLQRINMAFTGFLPGHLGVLVVYHFHFHIS